MNKKIKTISIFVLIFLILLILIQFAYKNIRSGNNIDKSIDDLIEYIFNISSYEADLEITIYSNKTINKYVLKQYYLEPNFFKQIIIYPENIKGLETIYDGKEMTIRNTNLGISKIYKHFETINDNNLWLNSFIENCKENKYNIKENEEEIIIENEKSEKLYIKKKEKKPSKIEIIDNNKNIKAYIEYKEIKVNNIEKNNIFAFTTKDIKIEL